MGLSLENSNEPEIFARTLLEQNRWREGKEEERKGERKRESSQVERYKTVKI